MKTKKSKKLFKGLRKHFRKRLKLAFIPHKHNQFRPHLVRRYGLFVVLFLAFGLVAGQNLATSGSILGVSQPISVNELVKDTNSERKSRDLPELEVSQKLSQAASMKAEDMLQNNYWAHTSPDGVEPWHWFEAAEYSYQFAGENLAKNFSSDKATTAAWMSSKEHRENILNPNYQEVGFAVATGTINNESTTLIVALFGRPVSSSSVAGVRSASLPLAAPAGGNLSPVARLGVAVRSLTPSTIGSFMLIMVGASVALLAHASRKKLPLSLQRTWYRHHGLYKALGMTSFAFIVIALYGGGQI